MSECSFSLQSFEDESMLGEVQFRKNSGFTTIDFARDSSVKTITVKLPPDAGTEGILSNW